MSQENLKLVRSISAAHERGDYGSAEWADPEIELFIVGGVPAGKAKGQAETSGMVREVSSEMELWRDEAEEYRELRDALPRAIARCLHTRWTPASLLAAAALLAGCGSATHATQPISTRAKHELLQEKYANERAKEESVKQKQRGLEEHHEAAERAAEARKEEQANAPSSHHYPPGLHAAFLRECYETTAQEVSACRCAIKRIEAKVPLGRFRENRYELSRELAYCARHGA